MAPRAKVKLRGYDAFLAEWYWSAGAVRAVLGKRRGRGRSR